jgi:hypothetical protein
MMKQAGVALLPVRIILVYPPTAYTPQPEDKVTRSIKFHRHKSLQSFCTRLRIHTHA